MQWVWALAFVAAACGTRPNPGSCLDGECSDPSLPFCDIEGQFGGVPGECVAVTCTAGEVTACRGDEQLTCNPFGNNFESEDCAYGCDVAVGGCRTCATNSDCEAALPVCDLEMDACRACANDDECESKVCDRGLCLDAASVVYAASDGASTAECTVAAPCSFTKAYGIAAAATPPLTLKLLPGTYPELEFDTPTTSTLTVLASGVTLMGGEALGVSNGANISMRGVELVGSNRGVHCDGTAARSRLDLSDARATSNHTIVQSEYCDVRMTAVDIANVGLGGTPAAIVWNTGTSFEGDRLHVHGPQPSSLASLGRQVSVTLTNSILEDVMVLFDTSDTEFPGSSLTFEFNTIVLRTSNGIIVCEAGSAYRSMHYRNNVIVGLGGTNVISGGDCFLSSNVLRPMSPLPITNYGFDPMFVDIENRNYRLAPGSPAIDRLPSGTTDHDFAGQARPIGAGYDLGAYEQ